MLMQVLGWKEVTFELNIKIRELLQTMALRCMKDMSKKSVLKLQYTVPEETVIT